MSVEINQNLSTPLQEQAKLAKVLGINSLYFKREDLHKYGSHKGRSIPFMIDYYHEQNERRFAISSSGNAALAAGLYVKELNSSGKSMYASGPVMLDIFVGLKVSAKKIAKLRALEDDNIRVLQKERPLQALTQAIGEGARSLRQSTDEMALIGYKTLAEELSQVKDLGAVFIGTSSGTTAEALAQFFSSTKRPVQVHIVQTSYCHPMAEALEPYDGPEETSIADAIVDLSAIRKTALIPLIKKTGGHGWIATNEDITTAQEMVKKNTGLSISTNSALSVVGAMKAVYCGWEIPGPVVCLICGD